MIYLNSYFTNAGHLFNYKNYARDYEIEEKIDIEIIRKLFLKYSVIYKYNNNPNTTGDRYLKINYTIINIFNNRYDIFK